MKPIIPIFFATDDNYAPFMAVAMRSIMDNSSQDNYYKFYVLNTYLSESNHKEIAKFNTSNSSVEFIDVTARLDGLSEKLYLRDYYTNTTYYRMFIPAIATQYEKVLYLDCDIVVRKDIAELYNHNIGDNIVGAIVEDVMVNMDVFGTYVEKALGINRHKFFNAGILVLNCDEYRKQDIERKFVELIGNFKFAVTQDEDYLNVLCKGRVLWINEGWNRAPIPNTELPADKLCLIHYKIAWKPWNYNSIMYEEYFWQYAKLTGYYDYFISNLANYAMQERDQLAFDNLVITAQTDSVSAHNYCNVTGSSRHKVYGGVTPQLKQSGEGNGDFGRETSYIRQNSAV